jgi:hypothetical protein
VAKVEGGSDGGSQADADDAGDFATDRWSTADDGFRSDLKASKLHLSETLPEDSYEDFNARFETADTGVSNHLKAKAAAEAKAAADPLAEEREPKQANTAEGGGSDDDEEDSGDDGDDGHGGTSGDGRDSRYSTADSGDGNGRYLVLEGTAGLGISRVQNMTTVIIDATNRQLQHELKPILSPRYAN